VSRKRERARDKGRPQGRSQGRPGIGHRIRSRIGLVLVLAAIAGFVLHAREIQYTQDDAYISLRYAKNLVDGHGLVFNPGERVEGYSNFTWTLLLAAFIKLGAPPIETSRWLGVVFGALAILVAARFARALEGGWGVASVATAALVAGSTAFALWSTGGLETALFALLVTAGLERGLAPGVGRRGRIAAPVLLCLAALTRPDGPLVFALWFAIRAIDEIIGGPAAQPGGRRSLVRDAVLFVGPLLPYAAWKIWYFGDLLPNTYYAKAGLSASYVSRGLEYALDFFRAYGLWGIAPALALASVLRTGWRGVELRLLAIWAGTAAYIVVIGGDVLHVHRFWLPILPIGCLLVARGITFVAGRAVGVLPGSGRGARPALAPLLSVVLTATLVFSGIRLNWDWIMERRNLEIGFVGNMTQTGVWLKRNFPPDATIAITTIGAISYWSELRVIDLLGLTDREIAREPAIIDGLEDTWREIKYNAGSVLRREPDAILFSTGVRPSSAAEKALFLHESFLESYYGYYFRSEPWRKDIQAMFRRRPDARPYWPDRIGTDDFGFIDLYMSAHITKARQQDHLGAAELFRQSMEAAPEFFWAREWWAVARLDGGDSTAVPVLDEVVRQQPYSIVALGRLADERLRSGDLESAEELFTRLREMDPDDSIGWMGMAEIYRMKGETEKAYEMALESMKRWDTNPRHLWLFGTIAAATDRLDDAERAFDRILRLEPEGPNAEVVRGAVEQVRASRRAALPGQQ